MEVFLSSPGHLTRGTLLSDMQANWHLAWDPERLAAPILGPEVYFRPLAAPGLSAPACAAATTSVGASSKMLPLAWLLFQGEEAAVWWDWGCLGLTGPTVDYPQQQQSRVCITVTSTSIIQSELCFDSGQQ